MVRKACFREVEVGRSRRCIRQIMVVVVVVVRLGVGWVLRQDSGTQAPEK